MTFLILALPRSRTYWLSKVLGVSHDQFRLNSVESGLVPYWRIFPKELKIVTIRRDPTEVVASLDSLGMFHQDIRVVYLDRKLDQLEKRIPGVLRIDYQDLDDPITILRICYHCGIPFKFPRWQSLKDTNLQINFNDFCIRMARDIGRLEVLSSFTKEVILWRLKNRE